eukprot:6437003-Amphidinium_carterae.1
MARCLSIASCKKGVKVAMDVTPSTPFQEPSGIKIAAHNQPRGRRAPCVVPEHKQVSELCLFSSDEVFRVRWVHGRLKQTMQFSSGVIPIGSRILDVLPTQFLEGSDRRGGVLVKVRFGVPFSIDEFTNKALSAPHPFDSFLCVGDDALRSIFWILSAGVASVQNFRRQVLSRVRVRAKQLEVKEMEVHSAQPACVAR